MKLWRTGLGMVMYAFNLSAHQTKMELLREFEVSHDYTVIFQQSTGQIGENVESLQEALPFYP